MPTPAQLEARKKLCESLVKNGAQVVRDGADHSRSVFRCIEDTGKVVGYYTMLMDYNSETDTFNNRHLNPIPASQVDPIAEFDAICGAIETVKSLSLV